MLEAYIGLVILIGFVMLSLIGLYVFWYVIVEDYPDDRK